MSGDTYHHHDEGVVVKRLVLRAHARLEGGQVSVLPMIVPVYVHRLVEHVVEVELDVVVRLTSHARLVAIPDPEVRTPFDAYCRINIETSVCTSSGRYKGKHVRWWSETRRVRVCSCV